MNRRCGECTLCCTLLPVRELDKGANQKCQFQTFKGCRVYNSGRMPMCCKIWNCRWLVDSETAALSRPDRSHYVLDIMPDFITVADDAGKEYNLEVVQVWVDPKHPEAHRDPKLREYLDRLGKRNCAAIIRYNATDAFVLFPPSMTKRGWVQRHSAVRTESHTPAQVVAALGAFQFQFEGEGR